MDYTLEYKLIKMIMDDPSIILLLKNKYVTENMWNTALENESSLIEHIDEPTEEMCLIALSDSGTYLNGMIERGLEITPEMIITAIESYPFIIFDLPSSMINEYYVEKAIDTDPSVLAKMDEIPYNYVMKKIKRQPAIIRYIKEPTDEMLISAINIDPNVCAHIKEMSPRVRAFIETEYADIASMLIVMSDDKTNDGEDIEWEE